MRLRFLSYLSPSIPRELFEVITAVRAGLERLMVEPFAPVTPADYLRWPDERLGATS